MFPSLIVKNPDGISCAKKIALICETRRIQREREKEREKEKEKVKREIF